MTKIENFIKDLQINTREFEVIEGEKNYKTILNYRLIIENLYDNLASWYFIFILNQIFDFI